ncbi:type VII secretion-associated serine protease mycosin [Streptomyces cucumeris]|uniref:type VII secretion-associated serine protease mycosin n=1 Tax=Streptomyces cucumeris TaxID=2962890 RepID=UPI0020C89236|nr:type VII secretion-associated serine protease mycosin [Streptomyces sp. NEAU-Y11]MCP9209372.1 type VII secretion-associated serine protease mycosin [Streptomyces sp. NEAU-Y11]
MSGLAPVAVAEDISSKEWHLDAMRAEQMWKVSKGKGVTVAVIDSGVDASLPELRGQLLKGADASRKGRNPHRDSSGHGSNMAGLIAGTGAGGGVQGLAPEAKILPIAAKMIDTRTESSGSVMAKAIRYAVDHGARVLNISLAAQGLREYYDATQSAVNYALKQGSLIFAGTGNDGDKGNLRSFPAALSGVVGIGAIDRQGKAAEFSTTGDYVGLTAFGDQIAERCTDSEGTCMSGGTSQATAIASASAALIWAKHPKWTNNQVLRVMMQTAAKPKTGDIPSSYVGYGSVRPRKVLLDGEGDPGPANTNPLLAREGATKPNPSPSASKSSDAGSQQQSSGSDSGKQGEQDAQKPDKETKASDGDNGGNTTLWIALGAGAAVVVGGAAAFAVLRRRNGTL